MIITFLCRARELNERVGRFIRLECRDRNAWSVVLEFLTVFSRSSTLWSNGGRMTCTCRISSVDRLTK